MMSVDMVVMVIEDGFGGLLKSQVQQSRHRLSDLCRFHQTQTQELPTGKRAKEG